MKKLAEYLFVVLGVASVAFGTMVNPPPDAPSWWNSEIGLYAYAWSGEDIEYGNDEYNYPPIDPLNWATNYLPDNSFSARITKPDGIFLVVMGNEFHQDFTKKIFVYFQGTTSDTTIETVKADIRSIGGTSSSITQTWNVDVATGEWFLKIEGWIFPQPSIVTIDFTVSGLQSVTSIWGGEQCIPEPMTIVILSLGCLLFRCKLA